MECRYAWSHLDFKKGGYSPCFRFKNYPGYWDNSGSDKLPSQVINNPDFISVRRCSATCSAADKSLSWCTI